MGKPFRRGTALVGAAGEHFVAYRLSAMGFPVALTRGGSQSIDLMVGDIGGTAAVSLQVKTATRAWHNSKSKPEKSRWEWDVGPRSAKLCGEAIFYAFVDLRGGEGLPVVYIVPSAVVADAVIRRTAKRRRFSIRQKDDEAYREAWDLITDRLVPGALLYGSRPAGQATHGAQPLPPVAAITSGR